MDLTDHILDINTSIMAVPSQRHSFTMPTQSPLSKGSEDKISKVDLRYQQGKRSATLTDKSECADQEIVL